MCGRCKVNLPIEHYKKKRNGDLYKICILCSEKGIIYKHQHKCPHGKQKSVCKDCKGNSICRHNRRKYKCKDCNGNGICEHKNRKEYCKQCNGSQICEHNRERSKCKDCKGSGICEHHKIRSYCKDCKGGGFCKHNRVKYGCRECGGHGICNHKKLRSRCKDCNGSQICEHKIMRSECKICDPQSYLAKIVRHRVYNALKQKKSKSSLEYLGIDIPNFRDYLQVQFKNGMTWENHGPVWHIDHIVPLFYKNPDLEEVIKRLHYTNCQPLWSAENMSKGNRYIG